MVVIMSGVLVLVCVWFIVVIIATFLIGYFTGWKRNDIDAYPDIIYNEETLVVKATYDYKLSNWTTTFAKKYTNKEFETNFNENTVFYVKEEINHFGKIIEHNLKFETPEIVDSTKIREISYKKEEPKEKPKEKKKEETKKEKKKFNIIKLN